jgi:hypothetical protein
MMKGLGLMGMYFECEQNGWKSDVILFSFLD